MKLRSGESTICKRATAMLIACIAICAASSSPTTSQQAATQPRQPPALPVMDKDAIYIFDFIKESVFIAFCEDLALSEAQRAAVSASYGEYVAAMKRANDDWMAESNRIGEEVGWAPEGYRPPGYENADDSILRGRKFRTREQQMQINERGNEAVATVLAKSRDICQRMFDEITPLLTESQLASCDDAFRGVRRNVFFSTENHPNTVRDDLGIIIPNLHALLIEAGKEGGELHTHLHQVTPGEGALATPVGEIMQRFEIEFDAAIATRFQDSIEENREYSKLIRSGVTQGDAIREQQRTSYRTWRRKYDAIERASSLIAEALRQAGDHAAADAWLDRVNAQWYPVVFQPESTETLREWMNTLRLSVDAQSAANTAFTEYLASRRVLRQEAMRAQFALREYHVLAKMDPAGYPEETERVRKIDQRRRELCDRTNAALRTLLPDDAARTEFDARINAFRRTPATGMRELPF